MKPKEGKEKDGEDKEKDKDKPDKPEGSAAGEAPDAAPTPKRRPKKAKVIEGVQPPAHEIECIARVTLQVGPVSFHNTELWIGRFVEPHMSGTVRGRVPKDQRPPPAPREPKEKRPRVSVDGAAPKRPRKENATPRTPAQRAEAAGRVGRPPAVRPPPPGTPTPGPSTPVRPPPAPVGGTGPVPGATSNLTPPRYASRADIVGLM